MSKKPERTVPAPTQAAMPAVPTLADAMTAAAKAREAQQQAMPLPEPMKFGEWQEQQRKGVPWVLPSGLIAYLKPVGILDLAARGGIPAPLMGMAEKITSTDTIQVLLKELGTFTETVRLVVLAAVVFPKLVAEEPEDDQELADDELWIGDLLLSDQLAVFNWANNTSQVLRPFRPESDGAVET